MSERGPALDLLLIAMPWAEPGLPSIQLGILRPVAGSAGIQVDVRSYYLAWLEHLLHNGLTVDDYMAIGTKHFGMGLGDWIFAVSPLRNTDPELDARFLDWVRARGAAAPLIETVLRMRSLAPGFISSCADDLLAAAPRVVGFTIIFDQTVPSLALARALKLRRPDLHVMFGGACCEGPMGAALHRTFPWIDTVVRGYAERVLPEIMRDILSGVAIRPQPGLCYRQGDQSVAVPEQGAKRPPMDDVPCPDYDEYFMRLRSSPALRSTVLPDARLPFESARGCWWGASMHCTFCGLNGGQMTFASKSADRVLSDIEALATRYQRLEFEAVDNIIDRGHLQSLLPRLHVLRRQGYDLRFFYETKANLHRDDVRRLRDAGVLRIQPGIESLSTPILRLMRKGVKAWQNIRLLKWTEQFGIRPVWNIIYGFPGEPADEYAAMARRIPLLTHLKPPALVRLKIQRFSPYHARPAHFGLSLVGPGQHYRFLFPVDEPTLWQLAYDFEYTYLDGRDPETYVRPVAEAVAHWDSAFHAGSSLRYERGPGFLRVLDRRPGFAQRSYLFDEREARIYLACDAGAKVFDVWRSLSEAERAALQPEQVQTFLDELAVAGLIFEEGGRYLSLALPAHADADPTAAEMADEEASNASRQLADVG
jgi:ribosomal peptide maturation radical SAM protein 1